MLLDTGHSLRARQSLHVGVNLHGDVCDAVFEDSYLRLLLLGFSQEGTVTVYFSP